MRPAISTTATVSAVKDQVYAALDDEVVILHLKDGVYFGLNETGATVWKALERPCPVEELKRLLLATYEVEPEQCERDLIKLLEELAEAGLIEVRDGPAT